MLREKLLAFAFEQQIARARFDEHAETAFLLDQFLVDQFLVGLQNCKGIDPKFGRDIAHGRQRIAFFEHAVEYHRDDTIPQLSINRLPVVPFTLHPVFHINHCASYSDIVNYNTSSQASFFYFFFARRSRRRWNLKFHLLVKEPLVVVLPSDHRLAALKTISPADLVGETFVTVAHTAPVLRGVIDNYLKRSGVNITPAHEVDHLAMAMSLIASTRGVGLLPVYAENFLASSLTSRPLKGDTPTIDLVLGHRKSNKSPILKLLLSRLNELVARASKKTQ